MIRDDPKPFRIDVRIRNNRLIKALEHAFPYVRPSGPAWAEELGIGYPPLNDLIRLKTSPKSVWANGWTKTVLKICEAVGEIPDYLFDMDLYGKSPEILSFEVEPNDLGLAAWSRPALPPAPDDAMEEKDIRSALTEILSTLKPREEKVIRKRFGLGEEEPQSLAKIAREWGLSHERIRQIEIKALAKLRHTSRSGKLIDAGVEGGIQRKGDSRASYRWNPRAGLNRRTEN